MTAKYNSNRLARAMKKRTSPKIPGKKEIRERVGSVLALARQLGMSRAAVSMWNRVPVHHVLTLEQLFGWSRYDQRPDIYGPKPGDTNSGRHERIMPKKRRAAKVG